MAVTAFQSEVLRLIAVCGRTAAGELFRGTDDDLVAALKANALTFHEGHIGGAWPRIIR